MCLERIRDRGRDESHERLSMSFGLACGNIDTLFFLFLLHIMLVGHIATRVCVCVCVMFHFVSGDTH